MGIWHCLPQLNLSSSITTLPIIDCTVTSNMKVLAPWEDSLIILYV